MFLLQCVNKDIIIIMFTKVKENTLGSKDSSQFKGVSHYQQEGKGVQTQPTLLTYGTAIIQ